jgi:fructose-1,6-bisphosphatase/inositol monophosphatase family enzyme
VIQKGERDLVSYVDVTAEKLIVEGLQQLLPEAGFITEEKNGEGFRSFITMDYRSVGWNH